MVRVATRDDVWWDAAPVGAFCWATQTMGDNPAPYRVIWSKAPNGEVTCLPVFPVPAGVTTAWTWDANEDKPTLTPSIYHNRGRGGERGWHGHFTAGRMVSC
jgi:hypothetical protein